MKKKLTTLVVVAAAARTPAHGLVLELELALALEPVLALAAMQAAEVAP